MGIQSFMDNVGEGAKYGLMSVLISIVWPSVALVIVAVTPPDYIVLCVIGVIVVTAILTYIELQHLLSSLLGFLIGYGLIVFIGLQIAPKLFLTALLQIVAIVIIKYCEHNK